MNQFKITHRFAAVLLIATMAGCGGSQNKEDRDFFTSGSREADQRAEQRMAKDEQLKGDGGSEKVNKSEENKDQKIATAKKSLYDRLGGDSGLQKIVDDFVPRVLADPRVNWERKGITQGGISIHRNRSVEWAANDENVKTLKKHLIQFLSLATGGPTQYDGRDMKQVHQGKHISNPEFDATVGDLKATLDKLQIPNDEQKELLAIIESTRPQVAEQR